jgi:hypothetical protein
MPLVARYAHHWNYGADDLAEYERCWAAVVGHAKSLGRDVSTMTRSVFVRWTDADTCRRQIDAFEAAGANLAFIAPPRHAPASVVDDIAAALV